MGIALIPVAAWYLGMAALLVLTVVLGLASLDIRGILGAFVFGLGRPIAFVAHVRKADAVALRAARARILHVGEEPELQALVARVAAHADLPAPRVALVRSWAANAFSVGRTPATAVVAVTTELLRRLRPAELEAVVAHELAHVANRDGFVMTLVGLPAIFGSNMWHSDDDRGKFAFLLYFPIFVIGLLLMWTISRYREYVADRGAVLITGAPENLMSALLTISGLKPRGDLRGGLAVQALCIVPRQSRWRRFELVMDHPPLEKRLERLEDFSRELGKHVS